MKIEIALAVVLVVCFVAIIALIGTGMVSNLNVDNTRVDKAGGYSVYYFEAGGMPCLKIGYGVTCDWSMYDGMYKEER